MNAAPTTPAIDIIVPVYNAPDDVRRCFDSVLRHTPGDYRLLLIDDASPDPRIAAYFEEIGQINPPRVLLMRNGRNLGFTATVNRGIAASHADVVLLNSDTIVTAGWLDALARCAGSSLRIATVTPFSNNAEIASFPRFCENNQWPEDADAEAVRAALADAAVPTYPDLPTGVGFCMFVRRSALDELGPFDMAFGAGYGEENDFCLRATAAGWRNVLADDAFVVHVGGQSFVGRKEELGPRNTELLTRRHPHYVGMVQSYIAADPLRPLREAAQSRLAAAKSPRGVLHVIHDHGGGTETHVRTLIEASRDRWRHYVAVAVGDRWQIDEHAADGATRTFDFVRGERESWHDFVSGIAAAFDISLVHVHHLSRSRDGVLAALATVGLPYGITIHDLWLACPTVTLTRGDDRFCGGVTDIGACTQCLDAQAPYAGTDIGQWRRDHAALVAGAAFVIAPSEWTAQMLVRYFPEASPRVAIIPHATPDPRASQSVGATAQPLTAVLLPDDGVPTVAIVGAIGRDKGARRIEALADLARERGARLRFVVIGYLDVQHGPWQSDDAMLTVHGRYAARDLSTLLAHYRVGMVVYPSGGPESFSYTLSEVWRAGAPALVPPIGALAERVDRSGGGWVMTREEWIDDARMLDRIAALSGPQAAGIRASASAAAKRIPHVAGDTMANATLDLYEPALRKASAGALRRFARARVRDALGYVEWTPNAGPDARAAATDTPARDAGERPAAAGLSARFAHWALSIRRTTIGRWLYRLAPASLINALKARLHA